MSDENRNKIEQNIRDMFPGVKYKQSDAWPIYIHSENLSIDNWENDIINSKKYFEGCKGKINMLLESLEGVAIQ